MTLLDPDLEAQLVDPATRKPLHRATDAELASWRASLAAGVVRRHDGEPPPTELAAAYVDAEGRVAYPVLDGLPSFLVEERLERGD